MFAGLDDLAGGAAAEIDGLQRRIDEVGVDAVEVDLVPARSSFLPNGRKMNARCTGISSVAGALAVVVIRLRCAEILHLKVRPLLCLCYAVRIRR
jgi:hypothetical protein